MRNKFLLLAVSLAILFVAGCTHPYYRPLRVMTYDTYRADGIINKLRTRNVQVHRSLSTVQIVIDADDLFIPNSILLLKVS